MARLTYDLALAGYRWEMARSHPRYFLPWVAAPDSRSGELFRFATVNEAEAADLEIPFYGREFQTRGTQRGETSWLWQRDYLDWIIDNPFTVTLKARQLGVSWIWDATILWDLIFFPGIDDLIYSIKEEDAIEQVNRIWDIWLTVPDWMKEMAQLTVLKPFGAARPSSRIEFEHPDGRVSTVTGMTSGKAVDQRHLDYTRGYYDGARFWLSGRIALAQQRVALAAKEAGADPRPTGDIDPRTGDPRHEGVGQ